MSNVDVAKAITTATYRMEAPQGCPVEIYQLMLDCWSSDPHKRPSFKTLFDKIEEVYSNQQQKVTTTTTPHVSSELQSVYFSTDKATTEYASSIF